MGPRVVRLGFFTLLAGIVVMLAALNAAAGSASWRVASRAYPTPI